MVTTDLKQVYRWTKKLLSMHDVHLSAEGVDRMNRPCIDGDRRFLTDLLDVSVFYCGAGLLFS